jgi:hypothetical protein
MERYKVIQWATGVVGRAALKGILQHPRLELVGLRVYSEEKEGKDAGELIDLPACGVAATRDVDEILAMDADCVVYCPMPFSIDEICQLLASGKNVVAPNPYWFPYIQRAEELKQIEEACRQGGTKLHASGCNPGGVAERFPLTFSGWCNRIDRITITECGDCRAYGSMLVVREFMNFGKTPEQARNNPTGPHLASTFRQGIDMIAHGLGCEVTGYETEHEFLVANQDIDTAVGVIEKGTTALNHYRNIGKTAEGTEIVQEQIWFMDDIEQTRLEGSIDIPRKSGWRIEIEGDPNLIVDIDFPPDMTQEEHVAQGMSTTGYHLVNAVPLLCQSEGTGLRTYLDLPMITGAMGTHEITR